MPAIGLLPSQLFMILRVVQISASSIAFLNDSHPLESFNTLADFLLGPVIDFLFPILSHGWERLLSQHFTDRGDGHRHELGLVYGQILADLGQVLVFFRQNEQSIQSSLHIN